MSPHAKQDRALTKIIGRLFAQHEARYGSPRIHTLLCRAGWPVSRRRIARLMRASGLRAKAVRIRRAKRNIWHQYARHPNRLWQRTLSRCNQVWVGDIAYFRAGLDWRYLAIIMDQYSRRILAWSLTRRRTADVTCAGLTQAARGKSAGGIIFYSDRGVEYMGAPFCARVAQLGTLQSANVRGPGDNAHAESFFHSLKAELTRGLTFTTDEALRTLLKQYMQYYNTTRLHSGLGYVSPRTFEQQTA